jgi:hypothetical protein
MSSFAAGSLASNPSWLAAVTRLDVAPAKNAVRTREMEGPVKLLANGVNKNGITRFGELIHSFRPQRHGKADEQHSFYQDDGKFQVGRDAAGYAFVISHGWRLR